MIDIGYIIYKWVFWIMIITFIGTGWWFCYRRFKASYVYLFLMIERLGIAITIGTAMYAKYLLLHVSPEARDVFLGSTWWKLRCLPMAISSTLYCGRLYFQWLRSVLYRKKRLKCPGRRTDDLWQED